MDEVHKSQNSLTQAIRAENDKFEMLENSHTISEIIIQAEAYHEKLINFRKNMLIAKDRISRLKKKATKLLEDKNREEVEKQKNRERREMLERHLEPVFKPNTKPNL